MWKINKLKRASAVSRTSSSYLLRLSFLALFVCALQIAYACWQISKTEIPKAQANTINVLWNPFYSASLAELQVADHMAAESRRRLGFMTFTQERSVAARQLAGVLHKKINLRPFDATSWAELVSTQAQARLPAADRAWSINAALKLGGWNNQYRLAVVAHCLERPALIFETAPEFCRTWLNQLDNKQMKLNARLMGVDRRFLKQRLTELDQQFSFASNTDSSDESKGSEKQSSQSSQISQSVEASPVITP